MLTAHISSPTCSCRLLWIAESNRTQGIYAMWYCHGNSKKLDMWCACITVPKLGGEERAAGNVLAILLACLKMRILSHWM